MGGYVVTNPEPTTRLRSDDLITVLAPATFGSNCFEKGLLLKGGKKEQKFDTEKLNSVSEEVGGSKESLQANSDIYGKELLTAAEVIIPLEDPLPSLPDFKQERAELQRRLAESLARERALRAKLRACQLPLPSDLETPRTERARAHLASPRYHVPALRNPPL